MPISAGVVLIVTKLFKDFLSKITTDGGKSGVVIKGPKEMGKSTSCQES